MNFGRNGEEPRATDEAWQVLGLVNDWVKHAETKAGIVLAAAGVLGGLLYSFATGLSGAKWWTVASLIVSVSGVLGAGVCGATAVVPRLRQKEPATSKIYYDHIARTYPRENKKSSSRCREFQEDFCGVVESRNGIFDELSTQIWMNSHIASVKYKWSTRAVVCVIAAAVGVAVTAIGDSWGLK